MSLESKPALGIVFKADGRSQLVQEKETECINKIYIYIYKYIKQQQIEEEVI